MKKVNILFMFLLLTANLFAQNGTAITGKVIDANSPDAIIGVSVTEIDANNRVVSGAITDINGEFSLKIKSEKNTLKISYIGYIPQTFSINGKRRFEVKLKDNARELTETVVTAKKLSGDGSFNIAKREISGAVQKIDAKEFEGLSVASVDDALQGRVSGLDIVGNSGAPGAGMTMRIRGTSSITGNANPLIVVNGIPFDGDIKSGFDFASANEEQYANLLNVNVDDIQEITVLKDAASTAVWGSKGANGVLMITTKKGIKGKTKVQYSYRFTQQTQPAGMKMLNGDDYTMLMKEEEFNRTLSSTIDAHRVVPELNYDPSFSEYENFNNNTDWVSAVTQTGYTHDHYLTVSGGGDRAKFRISGGYFSQSGTNIGQKLTRFSTRSQLDYQVSDRLKFTSEFSYTYTDNDKNYADLLQIAYKKMPNVSIYAQDVDGNNTSTFYNIRNDSKLNSSQLFLVNPVALGMLAKNNEKSYRIIPTFRLLYDFFDPNKIILRYNAYVSFDLNNIVDNSFLPYSVSTVTNSNWGNPTSNMALGLNTEQLKVSTENSLTWQLPQNDIHALMLYAAVQTSSSDKTISGYLTYGLPDNSINDPTAKGYLSGIATEMSQSRSIGFLTRAHYAMLGRYILDLTYRVDGNSKFGINNRFGSFPGLGVKWIVSDEPFMKPTNKWLSMLAFRPSWGVSGNEPKNEYLHISKYVADTYGYLGMTSIHPDNLQLSDLRWEKVTSTNLGSDIELFNSKVNLVLDWYHKRTDGLLFENLAVSPTSGYTTVAYKNVGIMDNDGWEINLDLKDVIKKGKFAMDFNFNISNYYNKIISLDDAVTSSYNEKASSITNGVYLTRMQENNSFGSIYGFRYKGVYQYSDYIAGKQENAPVARDASGNVMLDYNGNAKPLYYKYKSTKYAFKGGDAIYEDINHDGSIDEYDVVYLGNSNPKFSGGFGINFHYGDFSLRSLFTFRYGNKIINYSRMIAENMYSNDNQTTTVNWRWRKEGDDTTVPRAVYQQGYNWLGSDRYVEDGSFLRLKYLTFNYSVPSKYLKKFGLNQVNLYSTFNNIFCLTPYSGVDPEISPGRFVTGEIPGVSTDFSKTPRSRDWNFGITVGF